MSFVLKNIGTSKKEITITYIPLILIFIAFILATSFIITTYDIRNNAVYEGLNDKTIIFTNASEYIDGKRIYFSNEDLKNIRNIDGVKRADFIGETLQTGYKSTRIIFEEFSSEFRGNRSFKNYEKSRSGYTDKKLSVDFAITPYVIQHEYSNIFNPDNLDISNGDFPKLKNDIIIPDIYAEYISEQLGVDYDGLINKDIVIKIDDVDPKSDKVIDTNYRIVGIYKTKYENILQSSYLIYTGYDGESTNPKTEKDWNTSYKEFVTTQSTEENDATKEYMSGITKNLDSYKKAMGDGFSNIIIELNSKNNAESVTAKLDEISPKYVNRSRYSINSFGDYEDSINSIYVILIGLICLAIVMGLVITFINKGLMLKRNKKMSILYSLGYSKGSVIKLILLEIGLLGAISLIVVQVLNLQFLQYTFAYRYFENMLSPLNIIMIILFVILVLFISEIWAVTGINKRRLKKYLEVN